MFIETPRRIGSAERSVRLLVVEDEPALALQLSDVLTGMGWSIDTLADSPDMEGSPFYAHYPDAAVVDVDLRDVPLGPVARSLQRLSIPLVLCTGSDAQDDLGLSACPSIRKPASPRDIVRGLRMAIREMLERPTSMKS